MNPASHPTSFLLAYYCVQGEGEGEGDGGERLQRLQPSLPAEMTTYLTYQKEACITHAGMAPPPTPSPSLAPFSPSFSAQPLQMFATRT